MLFLQMRQSIALVLMLMLAAPVAVMAKDGKKHFREGIKYEENRQWDEAAKRFALAVAEKPNNIEYQLHLQRALVNAGLMLVERGDSLAEQRDYNAAYNAYRQAFAFSPANELALVKMRRMLEVQGLPTDGLPRGGDPSGPRFRPSDPYMTASHTAGAITNGTAQHRPPVRRVIQTGPTPSRPMPRTDVVVRSDSLLSVIEQLAQSMGLNVLFDRQVDNMRAQRISVELRNVTRARALEMILKTNNLMYSQIDSRTIVVALDNAQSRMKYEPVAVRTFYIKSGDLNDIRTAINSALNTKTVIPAKQLNALVVRDTPANLELIEAMINSMDKSKAEVLIDVNIYEVSRTDLLQLGNQINVTESSTNRLLTLQNLGGFGQADNLRASGLAHTFFRSGPLGFALGLPITQISLFQNRGKAKLLASTQVHVLDAETHTIRIGQRVPIQTASLPTFVSPTDQTRRQGQQQAGLTDDPLLGLGGAFGSGIPQIQYQDVGLNIDMQPSVYEDEVQMKMKIESTSVDLGTGRFTPTFNQRTMNSVARVKDGQTTLIAGVSQNIESRSTRGLPLVGLIPILGRFFATPETDSRQSDVVITVTPHILRRADIEESDHFARDAGTAQDPNASLKIDQILYLADLEDGLQDSVATRRETEKPFVSGQGPGGATPAGNVQVSDRGGVVVIPPPQSPSQTPDIPPRGGQALRPTQPSIPDDDDDEDDEEDDEDDFADSDVRPLSVVLRSAVQVANRGQDVYAVINVTGTTRIAAANIALTYDPNVIEVKAVRDGGLFRMSGAPPDLQFAAEGGVLNVQIGQTTGGQGVPGNGQLLIIVFTSKGPGMSALTLDEGQTIFRTQDGQVVPVRLQSTKVEVR